MTLLLLFKATQAGRALTGTITLSDPFGKPSIDYNALAEGLVLDNKPIGNTTLTGTCEIQTPA